MAWIKALLGCTVAGGCIAGVTLGAKHGQKGHSTTDIVKVVSKATDEQKQDFVGKLDLYKACRMADFLSSDESPFETIYVCSDESLYYLGEEGSLDWTKSIEDLVQMPLLKKIDKFHYKEEDSQSYLLFNVEGETDQKKISVNPLPSGNSWNKYTGFQSNE